MSPDQLHRCHLLALANLDHFVSQEFGVPLRPWAPVVQTMRTTQNPLPTYIGILSRRKGDEYVQHRVLLDPLTRKGLLEWSCDCKLEGPCDHVFRFAREVRRLLSPQSQVRAE